MEKTQVAVFGLRVGHSTVADVWRAVCEDIVDTIAASRASVWAFDDGKERLTCLNLFDAGRRTHQSGMVLARADHPDYFRALTNNARVVASDALNHPATRGFADGYFKPGDIRSLLDYIVLHETVPVGVLCCEQTGAMRDWGPADLACLQSAAMLIGTMFLAASSPP